MRFWRGVGVAVSDRRVGAGIVWARALCGRGHYVGAPGARPGARAFVERAFVERAFVERARRARYIVLWRMGAARFRVPTMPEFSDERMRQVMTESKEYCAVILKHGPNWNSPDRDRIIWEHGRRNFSLRADRVLAIVCPIRDGSDLSGIGIFDGTVDRITAVMEEDPGVKAGIFTYEIHACRSFPGDSLP